MIIYWNKNRFERSHGFSIELEISRFAYSKLPRQENRQNHSPVHSFSSVDIFKQCKNWHLSEHLTFPMCPKQKFHCLCEQSESYTKTNCNILPENTFEQKRKTDGRYWIEPTFDVDNCVQMSILISLCHLKIEIDKSMKMDDNSK